MSDEKTEDSKLQTVKHSVKLGGWGVAGVCVASPFVALAGAIAMVTFVAFLVAILALVVASSPLWGPLVWWALRDDSKHMKLGRATLDELKLRRERAKEGAK